MEEIGCTYQLVKVPTADTDVALVLVHASAEAAGIVGASGVLVLRLVGAALPQTLVHGLGGSSLLGLSGGAGATAREEATDGVADGGTDSDTARRTLAMSSKKV
jgi:hypothetical protein